MRRFTLLVVAGLLFTAVPVLAELCSNCKDKVFTKDIGTCTSCPGVTMSGSHKLCMKCSSQQGLCEHCKAPLAAASKPATQPATAPAADGIDASKSGKYVSGKWEYRYTVFGEGTRSEGFTGDLLFGGESVTPPASINDFYKTPWGNIYWVGQPVVAFGPHGWMPKPLPSKPAGKELPAPAAK